MSFFLLPGGTPVFPDPDCATPDGFLCAGGALTPDWLLHAYAVGIFPWYGPDDPILWWSPNPRCVIHPGDVHISRSMRAVLNNRKWQFTLDTSFDQVIDACASVSRAGQEGTWITEEMKMAYKTLHHLGWAHSAETWVDGCLVGGCYGVSIGGAFFGESMFSTMPNASKYAFIRLCNWLDRKGFDVIDCQIYNPHLASLGARNIPRKTFLRLLSETVNKPTVRGVWAGKQQ